MAMPAGALGQDRDLATTCICPRKSDPQQYLAQANASRSFGITTQRFVFTDKHTTGLQVSP